MIFSKFNSKRKRSPLTIAQGLIPANKISLLITAFFLFSQVDAYGTIYYVDAQNGEDSNDGLSATNESGNAGPWKSINKVNNMLFNPGDSILLKRGASWTDGPLIPKNGGSPGGTISIQDSVISQPIQFELVDPNNHNCIYFGAYGSGPKPKIECNGEQGLIIRHNYVMVENLHLDNGGNKMLSFSRIGGNYWNIVRNIDITQSADSGVRFEEGGGNCWLDGLYVYNYSTNGVYLEGSADNPLKNVLVENCRIENPTIMATYDGISCHRDGDKNNIDGNIIIRNNFVSHSGEDGIDVTSGTHILLVGNTLSHNRSGGIFVGKPDRVHTVEIRRNFLSNNSVGQGIGDLTVSAPDVRIVNNIIAGSGHHCLMLETTTNVSVWNNVIAPANRTGNLIWLRDSLSSITFRNNIFDFSNTDQDVSGLLDGVDFDYNCYYGNSKLQRIYSGDTFEEMQYQNASFEPNGFWADPLFINADKKVPKDFIVAENSPCLDAGVKVPVSVDFWGNTRPRGGGMDIGVFESEQGAPPATTETIMSQVDRSSDDAEESKNSGAVSFVSSDLEMADTGSKLQTVGIRFNNLGLHPGAVITKAYIQFTVDEVNSEPSSLVITGQAADNPATFMAENYNVSSRNRTTDSVHWNTPAWPIISEADVNQQTPDLKTIVQEIVDRPGWATGNSIAFLIEGQGFRTAESFDGNPRKAPKLFVDYSIETNCPIAGSACNDDNPATYNDVQDGACRCVGTPCPEAGTACDDGNPDTAIDLEDGNCNCIGTQELSTCNWSVINENDFESGWGIWNAGGIHVRRSSGDASFANSGEYCVRFKNNGIEAAITTNELDLSAYRELRISFSYISRSMEDASEGFWLQISTDGGNTYSTIKEWRPGDEFENDVREFDLVNLSGPFTTNIAFRFRCNASGNQDWLYIDDIMIEACGNSGNSMLIAEKANPDQIVPSSVVGRLNNSGSLQNEIIPSKKTDNIQEKKPSVFLNKTIENRSISKMKLSPNPVGDQLTIRAWFEKSLNENLRMIIRDLNGRLVRSQIMNVQPGVYLAHRFDVGGLRSGVYFISLHTDSEVLTKRFVRIE